MSGPGAESFRNGIGPSLAQGLAVRDAVDAQPKTTQYAETFHRLHRVGRAARIEAAALAKQGAQHPLVAAQEDEDEVLQDLRGRRDGDKVAALWGLGYNTPPLRLKEKEVEWPRRNL